MNWYVAKSALLSVPRLVPIGRYSDRESPNGNRATLLASGIQLLGAVKFYLTSLALMFTYAVVCCSLLLADPIAVRHREGVSHGLLVLRTIAGKTIATGDLIQEVKGDEVTSELVFHFKDGSIHDETTVFSQHHTFHLLTDHLIQKGPSFPHPIEVSIDASKGEVHIRSMEDGEEKVATEHVDIPEDSANGMILTLLKNISAEISETKVSMITTSSKPQRVTLAVRLGDQQAFKIGGVTRKATNYTVKVEIGGVKGMIAPIVGKQPPDTHVWILNGRAPTFLRSEGTLYQGGPIWRIELANVEWADTSTKTKLQQKTNH